MLRKLKPVFFVLIFIIFISLFFYLRLHTVAIFNPQGTIARQERNLILIAVSLMLVVLLPMLLTAYFFAWKYREGGKRGRYDPEAGQHLKGGVLWLVIPALVILGLGIVIWTGAHNLDPYRPLRSDVKPVRVQVVALNWKWLFLYPDQGVAAVNYLEIPERTPVNFELTADAPMNSFWIPQLGGQIYAMSGMSTQLHLEADNAGEYRGQAAEINGQGYAGMNFRVLSVTQDNFNKWVAGIKKTSPRLSWSEYNQLAEPSENNPAAFYSSYDANLYDEILFKNMGTNHKVMPGMNM